MSSSDDTPHYRHPLASAPERPQSAPAILPSNNQAPLPLPTAPPPSLGAHDDDITTPHAFRSISACVSLLMAPPKRAYAPISARGDVMLDRVHIELGWCKRVVSEKHFVWDAGRRRSVLRGDSKIRVYGLAYGLPKRYHEWLCGGEVSNTPFMVSRDALYISKEEFVRMGGGVVG
ncbi:hypothetical protein IQ07DRAFT_360124 [Pyrenochaeta sp. DS3sAY3a]|nr:hypothetical protein IQ07DRAFT_360124 [Pyrenochaeta sp. DS3sAY3a]